MISSLTQHNLPEDFSPQWHHHENLICIFVLNYHMLISRCYSFCFKGLQLTTHLSSIIIIIMASVQNFNLMTSVSSEIKDARFLEKCND